MKALTVPAIFTIGHSNHPWERFAELLRASQISALIDVRSVPHSRFAHFNQAQLTARLAALDITYHQMGADLGGRPSAGVPLDYEAVAKLLGYREALKNVAATAWRQRLVLMCSEHEPLNCHRCLLVGRSLAGQGISVRHILTSGEVEEHVATEGRLLRATWRKVSPLAKLDEQLAEAYRVQIGKLQGGSR
jgi:uncharacterized protein (DUF488 family)